MEDMISTIWQDTLGVMEKKISKPSFETWIKPAKPVALKGQVLFVSVPNDFSRDFIESHYASVLKDTVREVSRDNLSLKFVINDEGEEKGEETIPIPDQNVPPPGETNNQNAGPEFFLNAKYKFERFVIGNNNRLAHAASLAVAECPAKAYNPLFIYGGVGLGKTHLLHAIGHRVKDFNKNTRVAYITSEKFTNEFIISIRTNKTAEFRDKYRNIDVLLIDDIQFLAGKEQTQEEFFHTFNTLHENNRQITISSDRPPKEIPTLEDRLRSRFEWGLITDIQPPDLETRIAIIQQKALLENIKLPDDVAHHIASEINTNIREMEGAIIRIAAFASLAGKRINLVLAKEALKDILIPQKKEAITIELIQKTTATYFGIRTEDLKSKKRTKSITFPRQIAMYLCRELTDFPLMKIGKEFGGKDHTTVMHACQKILDYQNNDQNFVKIIAEVKGLITE